MVRFAMQLYQSKNVGPLGYNFSGIGYGLAFGIFALAFGAFNVLALVAVLVVAIIAVSRRVRAGR
jgi:hypothetical protein